MEWFWSRVDKSGICWLYGGQDFSGYALLDFSSYRDYAHRLSYKLAHGAIPEGYDVHHKCFVPNCVRPTHLEALPHKKNTEQRQGANKNSRSGVRGVSRSGNGWRVRIKHNYKDYCFGTFYSLEEAEQVAITERERLFNGVTA